MRALVFAIVVATGLALRGQQPPETPRGVHLERYSWVDAEKLLTPSAVVVIPLGAALKEHGPHLRLRNDLALAEYFGDRIAAAAQVVVTPPLTYHFYPAFLDYPGSTSLSLETARDSTVQIVRSLAQHGPKRFYVLNTGISSARALEPAAAALARDGILLRYTDFGGASDRIAAPVRQQEAGSHADEIETSMMLYIDPAAVDMTRAVKDLSPPSTPMRFRRQPNVPGTYSPSGIWGDATLATREKGRVVVEGLVSTMLQDIEAVRSAALPAAVESAAPPPPPPSSPRPSADPASPEACTPGDERAIRAVGTAFNVAWLQHNAEAVAALWSSEGDIVHGDGYTERGRQTIQQNRAEQFRRREFRDSRHVLSFGSIRCITASIAVVDAKWELRGVLDGAGNAVPPADGLSTLVLARGASWLIEAYRYSVKPGAPPVPRLLSKPGSASPR